MLQARCGLRYFHIFHPVRAVEVQRVRHRLAGVVVDHYNLSAQLGQIRRAASWLAGERCALSAALQCVLPLALLLGGLAVHADLARFV